MTSREMTNNTDAVPLSLTSYFNRISGQSILTDKEEKLICKEIKKGGKFEKKARCKLLESNLRLVIKIAHNFKNYGIELEDLVSEGNLGLMRAAEKFDPKRGCKFISYAAFWIRQKIYKALYLKSRLIRLPVHAAEKHLKIVKYISTFSETNGRQPNNEEITNGLGLPKSFVSNLLNSGVTNIVSLSKDKDDSEEVCLADVLKDENAKNPSEVTRDNEDLKILNQFVGGLKEREKHVISRRFGLHCEKRQTLDEIGAELDLSRERVRQIQEETLAKLRQKFIEAHQVHS